ncbi:putative GTPase activating protein for Arf-domain-containing protein [Daedaleopsis nitida]|nr:putative GTPase activating protein for Arf-domain-containing protein [Daedaleopsis nitida]
MSSGMNKITAERNQRTVTELATQPGNDVCADCKSRNPRWASYNLGIFICVHCASIHRKMGTHISKVKSLTMDSWSKEQVETMKANGNVKSNAHYNPDEVRHPPPTNMIDQERDSELEKYIRHKYEYKKFVSRSSQVAALLGPSKSAASKLSSTTATRSQTMPPSSSSSMPSSSQIPATPAIPFHVPSDAPSSLEQFRTQSQIRSASQPVVSSAPSANLPTQVQPPAQPRPATQPPQQQSSNPVWNDLAQLQAPATNSSLPLQFASLAPTQPMNIPNLSTSGLSAPNQYSGLSASPSNPFPSQLAQQATGMFPGGAQRSMSLNTGLSLNGGMNMGGMAPGMTAGSQSMYQPQPAMGRMPTPAATFHLQHHTTPSPNPYGVSPQSLPSMGLGVQQQQPFAQSSFTQQMLPQQGSPMIPNQAQPQGSPMIPFQPQGSPMIPQQPLGQMQASQMFQQQPMQMGNSGMFMRGQQPQFQPQPQPQGMAPFGSPQPPFMGTPSPAQFMPQQQPQQQMYGQPNAFGGTGWQQPSYAGQQQQWGYGM